MRKSIVFLTLATIVSALTVGCMPNGEGPSAVFAPRVYPYAPVVLAADRSTTPTN